MITPVTQENLTAWATMCCELFPEDNYDECIINWQNGELPHEFIYNENGKPAAFISLALRHDYVEGTGSSPVGYLEAIYVKPQYRKLGIARKLVEFAKNWAREQGCTEFASDCELHNEESRLFHNSVGFTEANRIICFTMELDINPLECEYVIDMIDDHRS